MKLTRILAATDFSKFSGFAMEWAAFMAMCMKAELVILHVVPEEEGKIIKEIMSEGGIARLPMGIREDVVEERKKQCREQINMVFSREMKNSLKIEEIVKVGPPFLEIIGTAKEKDVDLIVLGTHGRTGLAHVLIGSVAEKVVHHAHCPVLTIKHPQYKFIAP